MEENKYTQFISKSRNEANKQGRRANTALPDDEMAKAIGGLGGMKEATCPVCGKPMKEVPNPYGDPYWRCEECKVDQICSDAEYIEILKFCELTGQTQGLVYPVWWDKVKK
ncbi:MAG: hypothetical protein K6G27_11470 [Lachnospiraceae bacterium]|nr:hypothetical protein [Lachnospiraceae bacterium]